MLPAARYRTARRHLFVCLVMVFGSASLGAAVADAGALEVGVPPAKEATEAIGGAVEEAGGAAPEVVTKPVEDAVAPVHEAVEGTVSPVTGATGAANPSKPPSSSTPPSRSPADGGDSPASQNPAKVADTAAATVAAAGSAATQSSGRKTGTGAGSTAGAGGAPAASATLPAEGGGTPEPEIASPRSSTDSGSAQGPIAVRRVHSGRPSAARDFGASPSGSGAVRAPLPKWVAYVWPAIAVARPDLADLLARSTRDGVRLALGTSAADRSTGSIAVAGIHASRGAPAADSSPSHEAPIPAAIRDAAAEVHDQPLAYLLVAVVLAAGFAAVLRYEFGHRGQRAKR